MLDGMKAAAEPACVTDYGSLYSRAYYAHAKGASSFDQDRFPPMLKALADRLGLTGLADVGGGSGMLQQIWTEDGRPAVWLDYIEHQAESFRFFDLSSFDQAKAVSGSEFIRERTGERWLTTCLDVAEHIDVEHLAGFLLNLGWLTDEYLLLSISTRPSSMGNRFHSTILPIETWTKLLSAGGFDIVEDDAFDVLIPNHVFSGASENLVAVSHWTRVNPFRDRSAHQHYLVLRKSRRPAPSFAEMHEIIARVTDTAYRFRKRELARGVDFPTMTYNVHFMQDWSFARSLLDVWPREAARIILRGDCVAAPFRMMIENHLTRVGVERQTIRSANEATFEDDAGAQRLVLTATEGQFNILHQANSSVLLAARRAGWRTICMQHGMVAPKASAHAAEIVAAWDEAGRESLERSVAGEASPRVQLLGSIKFLDALLPADDEAFENRFGAWTRAFKSRCLVALGLHWDAMNAAGEQEVLDHLRRAVADHPDRLFLIRPHVDDASIYQRFDLLGAPNVLLVDELTLISLDWPLARVLKHVDVVISTFSTILIDAAAAGAPCLLLPTPDGADAVLAAHLPVSLPFDLGMSSPVSMSDAFGESALEFARRVATPNAAWFDPSQAFFDNLASLLKAPLDPRKDLAATGAACASATLESARNLSFGSHPHKALQRVEDAVTAFLES